MKINYVALAQTDIGYHDAISATSYKNLSRTKFTPAHLATGSAACSKRSGSRDRMHGRQRCTNSIAISAICIHISPSKQTLIICLESWTRRRHRPLTHFDTLERSFDCSFGNDIPSIFWMKRPNNGQNILFVYGISYLLDGISKDVCCYSSFTWQSLVVGVTLHYHNFWIYWIFLIFFSYFNVYFEIHLFAFKSCVVIYTWSEHNIWNALDYKLWLVCCLCFGW